MWWTVKCSGFTHRVGFIWRVSLTSVCDVSARAPIRSCFLLLIYDYFAALKLVPGFRFLFCPSALCLRNTHGSEQSVDTLSMPVSPCVTPRVDAQHGKHQDSAQQHPIQDLTQNQPWGRRGGWRGVVWLGESGGWRIVFADIVSRGV